MPALQQQFTASGIAVVEYALTPHDLSAMDATFPRLPNQTAGARANAFSFEAQEWFATHSGLLELAGRLLRKPARLSRLQAFDKSVGTNWFVPWHQDRAEDGRGRPVAQLERTVALRVHLDDCNEDNGPLEVIPGSHVHGRLAADAIATVAAVSPSRLCLAVRGDIVAMRPLLLHRSQRARVPAGRRVVHLEFMSIERGK
jgi:ectoine hydroxylase-related dioxygenase (phytanoyl-CoA dioxygenase family)